ncbi:MAG: GAF domain-containing protein [Patescibacteria group bacterium]|nr:GAF domain-containing protein [Patescibacteria group bacterium]
MENKEVKYRKILSKIKSGLGGEVDFVLIMSAISALLKSYFNYFNWVGFYRKTGKKLLSVGPYQGNWACLHIEFGKAVCGTSANLRKTIIVPDVTKFPGYIACDTETKSEIVVPVFDANKNFIAVLDIDSDKINAFDKLDKKYLEEIVKIFSEH